MLVLDADRQALPGETAGRLSFIWRKAVPLYTAASELSSFPDGSANCGPFSFTLSERMVLGYRRLTLHVD